VPHKECPRFNQAVLKAVYLEDGKVKRAEFTDVFAALFSRPSSNKWVKCPRQCVLLTGHYSNLPDLRFRRANS
jgi:hypothetical protein